MLDLIAVGLGIAIIDEAAIAVMGAWNRKRMLDRTEELLSAARHFAHIGDDAVAVAAIDAVQLLDQVQIAQAMPVDDDIVGPAHLGDAIDREADALIERREQVDQRQRD